MVDVVLVDEENNVVGFKEKIQAHRDANLHRAFSVMLFTSDYSKMLIHKRASSKYHCGGLWTNACCSHPFKDEDVLEGAKRRLFEELGYNNIDLEEKFSFIYKAEFDNGLTEHEFDFVFFGVTNLNPPKMNEEEVEDFKWVAIEDLFEDIVKNENLYTAWFKIILHKIREKKLI